MTCARSTTRRWRPSPDRERRITKRSRHGFSEDTALGETLTTIADHLGAVEGKPVAALVRGFLIPEGHYRGGSAFPADGEPKDTSAVPES